MNPRILKKLSKRVVDLGLFSASELSKETSRGEVAEYSPFGASRKPSHRDEGYGFGHENDRHRMGGMFVLPGTMWVCWSSYTDCGTEYDGAIAWEVAERTIRDEILYGAIEFDEHGERWIDGKPPKYPRSTPAMLRAVERYADEQKRQDEERRQEDLRWRARLTA